MEGAHHHQQEVRVCEAVKGIFIYTECVCEKTSEEKGTLFLASEILHHPFYFHGICCLFVCGYMSIFFHSPILLIGLQSVCWAYFSIWPISVYLPVTTKQPLLPPGTTHAHTQCFPLGELEI